MALKLVSTDIDDTIVSFGSPRLAPEVINTFRELGEKGIYVVPNTGRGFHNLPENILDGNIKYAICANGAKVYDIKNDMVICSAEIDCFLAKEILIMFENYNIPRVCFADDGMHSDYTTYHQLIRTNFHKSFARELIITDNLSQFFIEHNQAVQKIIGIFLDNSYDKKMFSLSFIKKFADISITTANSSNIEINHKNATKAMGLKALCNYLNISLSEVVVAGDNENDISVLKIGKYKIVPENGTGNAKQYADTIVSNYENYGVIKKLRDIFLQN